MDFKLILTKWTEALSFFKWQNFSLLVLVSLNTFRRSLFIVFKYFWWFGLFLFAFDYFMKIFYGHYFMIPILILRYFFFSLFSFFVYLIVRASIELKNSEYIIKYLNRIFGFLLIPILVFGTSFSLIYMIIYYTLGVSFIDSFPHSLYSSLPIASILLFVLGIIFSTVVFASYFFFDLKNCLKSVFVAISNGFKFVFYFLPLCLIFGIISAIGLMIFLQPVEKLIWAIVMYFVYYVGLILFLAFSATLYFKIKHSNYNLFFKQNNLE